MIFQKEKPPLRSFKDYKNSKLKKWKNWNFSKGDTPWFWSKFANFHVFISVEIRKKYVFYDILERKNAFADNKNKKEKSRKNSIFLKGLVHGFDKKLAIFPFFLF